MINIYLVDIARSKNSHEQKDVMKKYVDYKMEKM